MNNTDYKDVAAVLNNNEDNEEKDDKVNFIESQKISTNLINNTSIKNIFSLINLKKNKYI